MDTIKSFRESIVFAPLRPEYRFDITSDNLDLLEDIELRLSGGPSFLPDPNHLGFLRRRSTYLLGAFDITTAITGLIQQQLDSAGSAQYRQQFQSAVQRFRYLLENHGRRDRQCGC